MSGAVEFELTKDDHAKVGRATFLRSVTSRRLLVKVAVFAVMVTLAAAVYASWIDGRPEVIALVAGGAVAWTAIVMGSMLSLTYLMLPRRFDWLYDQQPKTRWPVSVRWNDRDITLQSMEATGVYDRADFHRLSEASGMFLLYHSDALCNAIPQRVLDVEQIADIRRIIQSHGTSR